MIEMQTHFSMLTHDDETHEDLLPSALSVIGYTAQSLAFGVPRHKVIRHLRSERNRIFVKTKGPQ